MAANTRYDLVVRGADIPFIEPTVVEAVISDTQPDPGTPSDDRFTKLDEALEKTLEALDPDSRAELEASLAESDAELERIDAEFSPESLRAFDYVQPAYDPQCDAWRMIMTTKGLQQMSRERAVEVLESPKGSRPRSPLLACEGYGCPGTTG